mmetsp:Transcript_72293/g.151021  ORF Transcript_72293/g.151021 Transcript_72293/m.151021 type:complete len:111 (+) Transcript_72293:271-603(+)
MQAGPMQARDSQGWYDSSQLHPPPPPQRDVVRWIGLPLSVFACMQKAPARTLSEDCGILYLLGYLLEVCLLVQTLLLQVIARTSESFEMLLHIVPFRTALARLKLLPLDL